MYLEHASRKEIGALGEEEAARYLKKQGLRLVGRNIARRTGEIDLLMEARSTLHFIEVKTIVCWELPEPGQGADAHDPSENLHEAKVRRVARTAEWIVAERDWEGEWQVDAALVWLRLRDGAASVLYLPQIL